MSDRAGDFWWNSVTGPSTLTEEVADMLASGRCAILCLPSTVPWEQTMRDSITSRLRQRSFTRKLTISIADGSLGPEETIPSLLNENDEVSWRPGRMDMAKFLTQRQALTGQLVWVRGAVGESAVAWQHLCQTLRPQGRDCGLILLELRNARVDDNITIRYDKLVSRHSVRLMCDLLVDTANASHATDARRTYTAAVLSHLCDGNVELAARMSESYRLGQKDPLEVLERACDLERGPLMGAATRLWEAQLECLFPTIEHERLKMIEKHVERIDEIINLGLTDSLGNRIEESEDIEIGTLDWLCSERCPQRLRIYVGGEPEREHIALLHECRNLLAHHRCLTERQVSGLIG